MCDICSNVGPSMTKDEVSDTMSIIGKSIEGGADPEHFKAVLDVLLSTETEDRDRDVEAAWEDDYRGID